MASAYEMTTERQKATTSQRDTAKGRYNSEELNNLDADMEETASLSQTRLATGDSFFEESTLSSVEVNVLLPGESCDEDLGKEKEDGGEESVSVSANSVNDISRMSRSMNEESFFEDNERRNEREESISLADNIVPESASTCGARREPVKDRKNRSVLELRVRDRRACDSALDTEKKFRDSAAMQEDVRACCENVAEICLNTDEKGDEFEREIIGQQDGDSFYDAVRSGNVKRVSALIANGCVQNLDEPDWNVSGDPPLLMAATNHCLPVLR